MSTEDSIRTANHISYSDFNITDKYLQKPHHRKRLEIAVKLLHQEIEFSFPNLLSSKIRILDMGASGGMFTQAIQKFGYSVLAADIEHVPLTYTKAMNINSLQLDAAKPFPLLSKSLHGIFLGEIIEHIFDTQTLLQECYRVLTVGGVIVITTPNLATLQDRIRFLAGHSPRQVNPLHEYLYVHIRPFTYTLLSDCLISIGFSPSKIRSQCIRIEITPGKWIEFYGLASLLPTLGSSLIVSAIKRT